MSKTINRSLEEKLNELEAKANRIEQSKNTKSKIVSAAEDIGRISQRLDGLEEQAVELGFYIRLYEGAFGKSRPPQVDTRIRTALTKAEISDEELLQAAQNERLLELEDRIEEAQETIDRAIDDVKGELDDEQQDWESKLRSARELNKIVGSDSTFQRLIDNMRSFLGSDMWNTDKENSALVATWERYERKWEENTGKHGWETFQRDHGLNDDTIEELKQFSNDEPVRLSDLSLKTLKEIKRVPELESALQLEVQS